MEIPKNLPQYEDTTVLVMTMAEQEGVCYLAQDGELHHVYEHKREKPQYTDNEGMFREGRKGVVYNSGIPRELPVQEERRKFMYEFFDAVARMDKQVPFGAVYICAPAHTTAFVEKHARSVFGDRVRCVVAAQVPHEHPVQILERLAGTCAA